MSIIGYEEHLGFPLYSDDDDDHGDGQRAILATTGLITAPQSVFRVSPAFTEADLNCAAATDRRLFDTIQGALNAAPSGSTIIIEPGVYSENLAITKSVRLLGRGGWGFGGGLPIIQNNAASPIVTFTPPAGQTRDICLANLQLKQNWTGSGSQSWAFWLKAVTQGAGNFGAARNRIDLANCVFRQDTVPAHFVAGIHVEGWNALTLKDCQFKAGAAVNQYMSSLVYLVGEIASGKQAMIQVRDCAFEHYDYATTSTIRMDYLTGGLFARNFTVRSRATTVTFGSFGANTCNGLNNDSQFSALGNVAGYVATDLTA